MTYQKYIVFWIGLLKGYWLLVFKTCSWKNNTLKDGVLLWSIFVAKLNDSNEDFSQLNRHKNAVFFLLQADAATKE